MPLKTTKYIGQTCGTVYMHKHKEEDLPLRRMQMTCTGCKKRHWFWPARRPLTGRYR